jgi:hypothetical protein
MWMESFRNPKSLMRSSNMNALKLKILYKGLYIEILHQPMMTSMRKIQLKNIWHPT